MDRAEPAVQPDDGQHPRQGSALRPYRLLVRRVHGEPARSHRQVRDYREAELTQTFSSRKSREAVPPGFFLRDRTFRNGAFDPCAVRALTSPPNPREEAMKFYN